MEHRYLWLLALLVAGCSDSRGRNGVSAVASATPAAPASATPAATATPSLPSIDFAALAAAMEARKRDYLRFSATGGSEYAQLARLETGAPIDRAPLDALLDFVEARRDTADFKVTALLRILHLHGQNPALPDDWKRRAKAVLLAWRWWIDEPGRDGMVFWSENHYLMHAAAEYLAGQLWPTEVFGNAGLTGDQHRAKALPSLRRWFAERSRHGYAEWCSPVYYVHDLAPLANLIDFAGDPEVRTRAAIAMDLLLFDLARLTHRGSLGTSSGRVYEEYKLSGRDQPVGDPIEILWGTRGAFRDRGGTGGTPLATCRGYRVPHALLAIGLDKQRDRYVDRARVGVTFAEGPAEGIGFTDLEDGLFWWRHGGYMAPETIALTRRMATTWDLWDHPAFAQLRPLRNLPDPLLVLASQALGPISGGTLIAGADTYCFRTPDAQLASAIDYGAGRVGFQQHAWQATLDLDAVVFTTAPGTLGHDGPGHWTGSGSLPRVAQHEDVALVLYDPPPLLQAAFPQLTHAYFPRAAFDEVVERGSWTFGRKGKGYVGLWSARPTTWRTTGPFADRERVAVGARNAWICAIGREAEDGPFSDFVDALARARVAADLSGPPRVEIDAPGLGILALEWAGQATSNGAAIHTAPFPRFDNPYAQQARGQPRLVIQHAGAVLEHEEPGGLRRGDGL